MKLTILDSSVNCLAAIIYLPCFSEVHFFLIVNRKEIIMKPSGDFFEISVYFSVHIKASNCAKFLQLEPTTYAKAHSNTVEKLNMKKFLLLRDIT